MTRDNKSEWRTVPVEPTREITIVDDDHISHVVEISSAPTPPKSEPCDRNAVIEECWKAIEAIDDGEAPEYRACQEAIRAIKSHPAHESRHCEYNGGTCVREGCKHGCQAEHLRKSQTAAPDPRDEVIRRQADAEIGRVVWKFIDRMNDVDPDSGDGSERILTEFIKAVSPFIDAAIAAQKEAGK